MGITKEELLPFFEYCKSEKDFESVKGEGPMVVWKFMLDHVDEFKSSYAEAEATVRNLFALASMKILNET